MVCDGGRGVDGFTRGIYFSLEMAAASWVMRKGYSAHAQRLEFNLVLMLIPNFSGGQKVVVGFARIPLEQQFGILANPTACIENGKLKARWLS